LFRKIHYESSLHVLAPTGIGASKARALAHILFTLHPTTAKLFEKKTSIISKPTMKKPKSPIYSHRLQFSVGQTVALAAGAASFAAISTALLSSYWFSLRIGSDFSYVSRTVIASNRVPQDFAEWDQWNPLRDDFRPLRAPQKLLAQDAVTNTLPSEDDANGSTKVAWLMSFPNSGTSFTLHLTREASNCTTATNYALEGDIKDQPTVPAIQGEDGDNGPWLELIPNRETSIPHYILTKTHCGGFCVYCHHNHFIETPRSFQIACQSGTKALIDKKSGELQKKSVTYDSQLVKRAIRLIRNPLDNIVARFNLDRKRPTRDNINAWPEPFPGNSTGFQQWCAFLDSRFEEKVKSLHWIDDKLRGVLEGVPCKADFYRFVQWHNLASNMIHDMALPTLTIHYNDYRDNFDDTLEKILHFLELPRSSGKVEFVAGKEYSDYYTEAQKKAIYYFLREFATESTWNELKRYDILPSTSNKKKKELAKN
jgi:Sulfotransferase domain